MTGYTRQAVAQIQPGLPILSSSFDNEFNAIAAAFNGATGHVHSGDTGDAPPLTREGLSGISAATGLVAINGTAGFHGRTLTGTTNQITITNGDGASGNPTVSIPNNPVLSGNVTATSFTGSLIGGAATLTTSRDFSIGGTTGLTAGAVAFNGSANVALTLAGILALANGGTGATTASDARTNLGLGTMATQSAGSVTITGGSVSGITDLAIADGGTGASTAADARTNLGLGTMATQAASSVAITGGSITGITDLAVADGGTGSSTAAGARTNLGLVIGTDVQAQNARLQDIATNLTATSGTVEKTAANTFGTYTVTATAKTVLDDATTADMLTTLGAVPLAGGTMTGALALAAGAVGTPSLTFSGDLNTGVFSGTADTVRVATAGVERMEIDANGAVQFGAATAATGYTGAGAITLPATVGIRAMNAPKAWVNFNAQGTIAIRGQFNVSSITDLNIGRFTINYTNALSNANYAIVGNTGGWGGAYNYGGLYVGVESTVPTTTATVIATRDSAGTFYDDPAVCVIVCGE